MTDSERQKRLIAKRKAQGLVLKRVWVPPEIWPAIKDLATKEAEEFVFSGSYLTTTEADHETAFAYELAREKWADIREQSLLIGPDKSHDFCLRVLRAMLKTAPQPFTPTEEEVAKARRAILRE